MANFKTKGEELHISLTLLYPVMASICYSHPGVFRLSQPNPRDIALVANASEL